MEKRRISKDLSRQCECAPDPSLAGTAWMPNRTTSPVPTGAIANSASSSSSSSTSSSSRHGARLGQNNASLMGTGDINLFHILDPVFTSPPDVEPCRDALRRWREEAESVNTALGAHYSINWLAEDMLLGDDVPVVSRRPTRHRHGNKDDDDDDDDDEREDEDDTRVRRQRRGQDETHQKKSTEKNGKRRKSSSASSSSSSSRKATPEDILTRYALAKYGGLLAPPGSRSAVTAVNRKVASSSSSKTHRRTDVHDEENEDDDPPSTNATSGTTTIREEEDEDDIARLIRLFKREAAKQNERNLAALQTASAGVTNPRPASSPSRKRPVVNVASTSHPAPDIEIDREYVRRILKRQRFAYEAEVKRGVNVPSVRDYCHHCRECVKVLPAPSTTAPSRRSSSASSTPPQPPPPLHPLGNANTCVTCHRRYCRGCLHKIYDESLAEMNSVEWKCPRCKGECWCKPCVSLARVLSLRRGFGVGDEELALGTGALRRLDKSLWESFASSSSYSSSSVPDATVASNKSTTTKRSSDEKASRRR